ncbi:hypothetical protein HDU86_008508 [Geranomyces michiganensis]|nr:hypothetical protein HDU86_008508 [Geranomyces michiganensis]
MATSTHAHFVFDDRPAKRRFSVDAASSYFAVPAQDQQQQQGPYHNHHLHHNAAFSSSAFQHGVGMPPPPPPASYSQLLQFKDDCCSSSDDGANYSASEDMSAKNGEHLGSDLSSPQGRCAPLTPPPSSDDTKTKKRARATPEQLAILEETFLTNTSPNAKLREILAGKVHMTERSIQIWFQNRRAKVKLMQKRAAQQAAQQENVKRRQSLYAQTYGMGYGQFGAPQFIQPRPVVNRSCSVDFSLMGLPMGLALNPFATATANAAAAAAAAAATPLAPEASLDMPPYTGGRQPPQMALQRPMRPRQNSEPTRPPQHVIESWLASPASSTTSQGTSFLTADSLTIGTWRRLPVADGDLAVTINSDDVTGTGGTIRYEIADGPSHFKIEVPISTILAAALEPVDAFRAQLVLDVSMPPMFFMETGRTPTWTQCRDFTQGKQGTCCLRHVVRGDPATLAAQWQIASQANPQLQRITRMAMATPSLTITPTSASPIDAFAPMSPARRHSTSGLQSLRFTQGLELSSLQAFADGGEMAMDTFAAAAATETHLSSLEANAESYMPPFERRTRQMSTDGILDQLSFISLEPRSTTTSPTIPAKQEETTTVLMQERMSPEMSVVSSPFAGFGELVASAGSDMETAMLDLDSMAAAAATADGSGLAMSSPMDAAATAAASDPSSSGLDV